MTSTSPTPDQDRGPRDHDLPARPLTDRAAGFLAEVAVTDKNDRFEARFAAVTAARRRRGRRTTAFLAIGLTTAAVVLALVGWRVAGVAGVVGAVAAVDLLVVGYIAMQRVLRRTRGSSAWSWQTQRYVAIGNPSRDVQKLDEPRSMGGP